MKFIFNVAAISWMMSDSRMGLVIVYNAVGLMSNNVSLHVYTREVALCTGSSMYIKVWMNESSRKSKKLIAVFCPHVLDDAILSPVRGREKMSAVVFYRHEISKGIMLPRDLFTLPFRRTLSAALNWSWNHTKSTHSPTVWNSLPDSLRDPAVQNDHFRRDLKTRLFAVGHQRHEPMSALAVSQFHGIALYKPTFTYLIHNCTDPFRTAFFVLSCARTHEVHWHHWRQCHNTPPCWRYT